MQEPILSPKEEAARDAYIASLTYPTPTTSTQCVLAMIGLVGSGKSSVAEELAEHLGATVIQADQIRLTLRLHGAPYTHVRTIVEAAAQKALEMGGNIIFDADFSDATKRASLEKQLAPYNTPLQYVRVHCDIDIAIGRAITASYTQKPEDYFGGAPTTWTGGGQTHGAVVKVRELWRRTPWHYTWSNEQGGQWELQPFELPNLLATINTEDEDVWKEKVRAIASSLT